MLSGPYGTLEALSSLTGYNIKTFKPGIASRTALLYLQFYGHKPPLKHSLQELLKSKLARVACKNHT